MSSESSDKRPPSYPEAAAKGVAQLRDTAKWIVGIFGALGAAMIAGTQLAGLGKLEDSERLVPAVAAAGAGLICIGGIIWFATRVLTTGDITLRALKLSEAEWIAADKPARGSLPGTEKFPEINYVHEIDAVADYSTVDGLLTESDSIRTVRARARHDAKVGWVDGKVVEGDEGKAARERYAAAVADLEWRTPIFDSVQAQALAAAQFARVRHQFNRATRAMLVLGAIAAIAIFAFAWAVNPPEREPSEVPDFRVPVVALLALDDERREELAADFSAGPCPDRQISVVVLSATNDSADVVTVPTPGCALTRLTVARGELRPSETVDIPATPVTTEANS